MPRKPFGSIFGIVSRSNVVSIILISNTFIWYFTALFTLQSVLEFSSAYFWSLFAHFATLILAAFVGASLSKNTNRQRLIILWTILGTAASLTLLGLESSSEILVYSVSMLLGFAVGFGMPACMSHFTESGSVVSRGRVSGVTLFLSGIGIVLFRFLDASNLLAVSLILGIWRLGGLLVFLRVRDLKVMEKKEKKESYVEIIKKRSFVLYFLPWIMFSAVNYLAAPMEPHPSIADPNLPVIQLLFMGVAAILGGIFVDSMGRKPVAIAGFALLGVGTAVVGFFEFAGVALYFNAVIDGIAWGFLLVLFIMTLWGDLGQNSSSAKYYALGVMPFFLSKLLELTLGYMFEPVNPARAVTLFSLTAFLLFLAVLPLVYAPETLPERVKKERELTLYIEKAQKIAQKQ
jgi:MFS family permease